MTDQTQRIETPPEYLAEIQAAAANATGHTVGCMCMSCDIARAGAREAVALTAPYRMREPRLVVTCDDHKPVQHRDGKPPWCRRCGHGNDGKPWRDLPSPIGHR